MLHNYHRENDLSRKLKGMTPSCFINGECHILFGFKNKIKCENIFLNKTWFVEKYIQYFLR